MHVAQSGIFGLETGSHSSLEFDLLESADLGTLVQAIANLGNPARRPVASIWWSAFGRHCGRAWHLRMLS